MTKHTRQELEARQEDSCHDLICRDWRGSEYFGSESVILSYTVTLRLHPLTARSPRLQPDYEILKLGYQTLDSESNWLSGSSALISSVGRNGTCQLEHDRMKSKCLGEAMMQTSHQKSIQLQTTIHNSSPINQGSIKRFPAIADIIHSSGCLFDSR